MLCYNVCRYVRYLGRRVLIKSIVRDTIRLNLTIILTRTVNIQVQTFIAIRLRLLFPSYTGLVGNVLGHFLYSALAGCHELISPAVSHCLSQEHLRILLLLQGHFLDPVAVLRISPLCLCMLTS